MGQTCVLHNSRHKQTECLSSEHKKRQNNRIIGNNKTLIVPHIADVAQAGTIQMLHLWIPHIVQPLWGWGLGGELEFFEKLNKAPFQYWAFGQINDLQANTPAM